MTYESARRRSNASASRSVRRSFVELTPAGLEALHATRARREDWLTQTLDRELDADERDVVRRALSLLGRVADA